MRLYFVLSILFLSFLFVFSLKNDLSDVTSDPLTDTSIDSPISSSSKIANASSEDADVKKSIQAKVKKLKALKLEARQIASQLRKERKIKAVEGIKGEERIAKLKKWKERMRKRVKALIKRVSRMEKVMKLKKAELANVTSRKHKALVSTVKTPYAITVIPGRKGKHQKQGKKQKNKQQVTRPPTTAATVLTTAATRVSTSTIPSAAVAQTPVITTPKANKVISKRSHRGSDGSPCETHHDCAPGHCCHRFGALHGAHSAVCLRHDAKEGAHCEHSCACVGSLKCVKSSNPRTHASEQAHCRRIPPKEFSHHSPQKAKTQHSNNRYHLRYN